MNLNLKFINKTPIPITVTHHGKTHVLTENGRIGLDNNFPVKVTALSPDTDINAILALLVASGIEDGTLDVPSETPTGQGLDDITTLTAAGWTITTALDA